VDFWSTRSAPYRSSITLIRYRRSDIAALQKVYDSVLSDIQTVKDTAIDTVEKNTGACFAYGHACPFFNTEERRCMDRDSLLKGVSQGIRPPEVMNGGRQAAPKAAPVAAAATAPAAGDSTRQRKPNGYVGSLAALGFTKEVATALTVESVNYIIENTITVDMVTVNQDGTLSIVESVGTDTDTGTGTATDSAGISDNDQAALTAMGWPIEVMPNLTPAAVRLAVDNHTSFASVVKYNMVPGTTYIESFDLDDSAGTPIETMDELVERSEFSVTDPSAIDTVIGDILGYLGYDSSTIDSITLRCALSIIATSTQYYDITEWDTDSEGYTVGFNGYTGGNDRAAKLIDLVYGYGWEVPDVLALPDTDLTEFAIERVRIESFTRSDQGLITGYVLTADGAEPEPEPEPEPSSPVQASTAAPTAPAAAAPPRPVQASTAAPTAAVPPRPVQASTAAPTAPAAAPTAAVPPRPVQASTAAPTAPAAAVPPRPVQASTAAPTAPAAAPTAAVPTSIDLSGVRSAMLIGVLCVDCRTAGAVDAFDIVRPYIDHYITTVNKHPGDTDYNEGYKTCVTGALNACNADLYLYYEYVTVDSFTPFGRVFIDLFRPYVERVIKG
jgi:hypothetical protein